MSVSTTDEKSDQAFVVWLDPSSNRGRCVGWVEHVATSDRRHFVSTEEMVAFMTVSAGRSTPAKPGPVVSSPIGR